MAFSKTDLERIKSKIILSDELAKKAKVVKKGKDSWCCCPFHEEKTPSCKINDDIGTYYCFGCGAKGDIFSLYTDLYKYSFLDAVKELSSKTGITINFQENKNLNINDDVFKILELTTKWFEKNLQNNSDCINYFKKRNIDLNTINFFRLGYSYNPEISLYKYLKSLSFKDEDLLKSNVVKLDKNPSIVVFVAKSNAVRTYIIDEAFAFLIFHSSIKSSRYLIMRCIPQSTPNPTSKIGTIIAKKLGSKSRKLANPLDQIIAKNNATIVSVTSKDERKVANKTPITRKTTSNCS